jgi:catechol 2,3-dioxygenase-like lactoylglutathione lyase family enzyme
MDGTLMRGLLLWMAALAAAGAQELPLEGITHVAVRVGELANSRSFYTNTLGFDQAFLFDSAGSPSVSFLKINDRQYIELYAGVTEASGWLMHVCFETHDLDAVRRRLVARGLHPSAITKGKAGNLLCALKDPDGQTVEFLQYLPGSMHCLSDGTALSQRRITTRLLSVAITARNIEASRAFYRDKLGFREVSPGALVLRVPGSRGDSIELVTGAPRLCFKSPDGHRDLYDPNGGHIELMAPPVLSARPDKP